MKQSRFQSRLLWVAILTQVLSVLLLTGVVTPAESELINQVSGSILQVLVLVGVLNDPTTKGSF